MIVAFDFDGTWTRDPDGMRLVAQLLQARGHTCILLTGRSDEGRWGAEVRAAIGDLMPIVFAGGTWKRDAAKAAGYDVQIFVDDLPEYIAAQDPRRTVGRPKILEDGWVDLPGGARLRYEIGQSVELATVTATITPPAVACDVTAEQVVAYLLRKGWRGPVRKASLPESHFWTWVDGCQFRVELPTTGEATRVQLRRAVKCISRAESRHAFDVVADIVGPVVGTVGVGRET